jgi:phytoene desaturase
MQKPTAVVIGAGIGGIATAARLAKNGYNVTVLEKETTPGGRANQILRDGHRFDIGPTLFLMPEIWEETFAALDEKMNDHLELKRIDPTYKVHFDDGLQLALTSNIGEMQAQLKNVEKTAFTGFLNYIAEGSKHYKMSLEKFVGRNFYNIFEYFSLGNLPLLFQLKALKKHHANASRFFKDERLKAAFTFQNMYLGLSPYEAPATYSLLQYTELAEGVWYPMGGMYAAIEALVKVSEKLGVKFIYNAPVKKLRVKGSKIEGVELEDGREFTADIFVGNADLPYIYRELLPDSDEAKKLDQKRYTCSTIMFYWGVEKEYTQIAHHNVFLGGDYRPRSTRSSTTTPCPRCRRSMSTRRRVPIKLPHPKDRIRYTSWSRLGIWIYAPSRIGRRWSTGRARLCSRASPKSWMRTTCGSISSSRSPTSPKSGRSASTWKRARHSGSVTTSGRWAICARRTAIKSTRTSISPARPRIRVRACQLCCCRPA